MTPKDKEDQEKNYTVTPTNLLADKSNFLQINHEKQYNLCQVTIFQNVKSKY